MKMSLVQKLKSKYTEKSQIKTLNTEIFNKCINAIKQFDIDDKLIKSETNNIWKN